MASVQAVKLSQMVDLALGTPELGAVNFNVLHTLLHAIITKLNIGDVMAEIDEEDHRALKDKPISAGGKGQKVHFQDDRESVVTVDSGVESVPGSAKAGVIPRTSPSFHSLQDRIHSMERQLSALNGLPKNKDILDELLGGSVRDQGTEKRAVSDLWQMVSMKRRVDANEEGLGRLSSLIDDLMKEMRKLQHDNDALRKQMSELSDMSKLWDKINGMDQAMKTMKDALDKVNAQLSLYPHPDVFKNYLTWEALEAALRGLRDEIDRLKGEEKVVIEMATDSRGRWKPMSRPHSQASGPSEALMEMLESLGKLTDRHESLEVRVDKIEQELPNKADKKDLENFKIPDDLLQRLSDMKAQLDNMMTLRNRDNEAMSRIREALTYLQKEIDRINNLVQGFADGNAEMLKSIQDLFNITTDHEGRKADLSYVDEKTEPKAERKQLDAKVNFSLFDETTGNLHKLIEDLLQKLLASEEELRRLLSELTGELDGKLDRMELDPLKEWLEKRLKALAARMKTTGLGEMSEDEAAGLKKQLLQHFHCISCDRPIDMGPQPPPTLIPDKSAMPPSKSLRPYTTFELDAIRQHARKSHKERINASIGGEIVDMYYTPRACGGSHTTTYPTKRVAKAGNTNNNAFGEEEGPVINKPHREELDLQGVDGHIYKGRIDRLYSNQPPDDSKLPPVTAPASGASGGAVKSASAERPRSARLTPRGTPNGTRARPMSGRATSDSRPITPGMAELGPAPTPSLDVPQAGLDEEGQPVQAGVV